MIRTATFFLLIFANTPDFTHAHPSDWERRLEHKARRMEGDFYYVGLQQIADILGINTYYSNKVRKAILYVADEKITVSAFNSFVIVGKRVVQMPIPAQYDRDDIQLPVKFFIPILRKVLAGSDEVESNPVDNRTLPVNIEGVSVEDKANGTLIRIRTLAKFEESSMSTRYSRRWLYVDILGGSINPTSFVTLNQSKLIKKVVPVQMTEMLQLSFRVGKEINAEDVQFIEREGELWLSIPKSSGLSRDVVEKLKNDQEKWQIDKVVIDPGHGGRDPGTIGSSGTYEKDVVLAIAKRLKTALEKKLNIEVLMTREDDEYISLKERTQYANKNQGKLFISLHANWNRNPKVNGAATYFLGLAKSDEAIEISQLENAAIKYDDGVEHGDLNEEQIILATMAQNSYNKESQNFAAMIQDELDSETKLRNRGVKQAGFYVMLGASMPNVLVETAFMSNKREERLLNTPGFQKEIAEAIFRSVKRFKEKYEMTAANGR